MYGVTAFFGGYFALDRHSEQREIAYYIEDLVTDEFVVGRSGVSLSMPFSVSTIALSSEPPRARFALQHLDLVCKPECPC